MTGLLDFLTGKRPGAPSAPPVRPIGIGVHGQPIVYSEDAQGLTDAAATFEQQQAIEDDQPIAARPKPQPDAVNEIVGDTDYWPGWTQSAWRLNGSAIVVSRFYRFKNLAVDMLYDGQTELIRRRRMVIEGQGIAYVAYMESDEFTASLFTAQWKASARRAARIQRAKTLR